jgi:hypothetical protein
MEKNKYFKSLSYSDREQAKATLAEFLLKQEGWKVYGYREDTSDSMTDYFNPAHWWGIATFGEFVLVVDCSDARESGKPITNSIQHFKPCEHCLESGEEPNGWTYEQASADPKGFWASEKDKGRGVLMNYDQSGYVPKDFFNEEGNEKCNECRGTCKKWSHNIEEVLDHHPIYQANPDRKGWHLERNGKILTSGVSLARMYRGYWEGHHQEQKAQVEIECKELVGQLQSFVLNAFALARTEHRVNQSAQNDSVIEIIDYSEKAIALRGNTKPYKDKLGRTGLGGTFNAYLKDPGTGEKFAGWIFSKKRLPEVQQFISSLA